MRTCSDFAVNASRVPSRDTAVSVSGPGPIVRRSIPVAFKRFRIHGQLPYVSSASIGALEINSLAGRGPSEREVDGPLSPDVSNGNLFELFFNVGEQFPT